MSLLDLLWATPAFLIASSLKKKEEKPRLSINWGHQKMHSVGKKIYRQGREGTINMKAAGEAGRWKEGPGDGKLRRRKITGLVIKNLQFLYCSFPFTSENHRDLLSFLHHTYSKLDPDLPSGWDTEHTQWKGKKKPQPAHNQATQTQNHIQKEKLNPTHC